VAIISVRYGGAYIAIITASCSGSLLPLYQPGMEAPF
jgi:hypothetical protein